MKIALLLNAQNFASSLLPELERRGHEVSLYTPYYVHLDKIGYRMNPDGSFPLKLLRYLALKIRKMNTFDFVLNYAGSTHLKGPEAMYWQGVETWPEWRDRVPITKPGYYCTPDIAHNLPDGSLLLPRAVNMHLFKGEGRYYRLKHKHWDGKRPLRIGHFWKRHSIEASYTMRYWKKTDVLNEALTILNKQAIDTEVVNGPIPREKMPETLASLDVLAEEFGYLSHGATAVEALLTGVPVVGSYNSHLCESREALEMLVNVSPHPEAIAGGILKAVDHGVGSTSGIEEYYRPAHAADILEDTWKKFAS